MVPASGQLALDMMCGEWGAIGCTAARWFKYMGDEKGNPYVPFQITYISSDGPVGNMTPPDLPILPCSAAVNVSRLPFIQLLIPFTDNGHEQ